MTKFEVRVQQTHLDYYHIEADDIETARYQVLTGVKSGILGNIVLDDTIKRTPIVDYAIPFPCQ
tara:strand:- start:204 stop:395 length:192 start_codon:yes stop_codon:yes gene_type:complete